MNSALAYAIPDATMEAKLMELIAVVMGIPEEDYGS